jgi:alkylation response protein AidB-like acyl-CoA dehydrogenase
VLLVLLKTDYTLERLQGWDTLGMRGTSSEGFTLRARAAAEQIMPEPYERIHAQTMVPFAHILWGSVWAGIAAAATGKAQNFMRNAMRQSNGQMPPGAPHFTQAVSTLRTVRGVIAAALRSYQAVMSDEKALTSLEFQSMITLTKVQASELAATTVMSALRACGLSGYRNDTEFSIGRHLRDILSAPIMISNDRILANLADVADDAAADRHRGLTHVQRQGKDTRRRSNPASRSARASGRGACSCRWASTGCMRARPCIWRCATGWRSTSRASAIPRSKSCASRRS